MHGEFAMRYVYNDAQKDWNISIWFSHKAKVSIYHLNLTLHHMFATMSCNKLKWNIKKMVSATLNHYKGGVRMGLQNMSVLVCPLIFMYAFWKWRWLWRVCVQRFRDVSELEEATKQGGHREPLHCIRSHQWIWPQHHPDLQPTHVGEAGDGVKMRTWFPGLLCSSSIQNMFQRGR